MRSNPGEGRTRDSEPGGNAPSSRPSPRPRGEGGAHENLVLAMRFLSEASNDLSHYDLGGRRLDRNLADALSLRRERSDHVALAGVSWHKTRWSISALRRS